MRRVRMGGKMTTVLTRSIVRQICKLQVVALILVVFCAASPRQTRPSDSPGGFVSLLNLTDSSLKGWSVENRSEIAIVNSEPFGPPDHLVINPLAGWIRT